MQQFSRFLLVWMVMTASGLSANEVLSGADIAAQNCLGCHVSGAGRAPKPNHLQDWERVFARNDYATVVQRAYDGFGRMPTRGFCTHCDRHDIERAIRAMMPESLLKQHPLLGSDS